MDKTDRQTYMKNWAKKHPKNLILKRQKERQIRVDLIKILGGKCIRCNYKDPRALQFDHIKGDGYKTKHLGSETFYRFWLTNPKIFKKEIQLLCANCNWIKRAEKREYA